MGRSLLPSLGLACALALGGCNKATSSKSLDEVSRDLTDQFRRQHDSAVLAPPKRQLKFVNITEFSTPSGNPRPYLGVAVAWEGADTITYTSLPMIQLGDGLFAVTYQDPATKEHLSAILSFR